jgi:hypothetical protein
MVLPIKLKENVKGTGDQRIEVPPSLSPNTHRWKRRKKIARAKFKINIHHYIRVQIFKWS